MEKLITLEQLKEYDNIKGTPITYVGELPGDPDNRIYAISHQSTETTTVEKDAYDLIGSYFVLDSTGKYISDNIYQVKYGEETIGSLFVSGDVVNIYHNRNFTDLSATTLNTIDKYNFTIIEAINHFDCFVGNKNLKTFTKVANVDQVEEYFIRKTEKGTVGGVATLDENGHVPVSQMPSSALIYKGQWDASSGTYPASGITIGDFYIVNVAGTISGVSFLVGDWLIWNGTSWDRSANANAVSSVNGQKGAVIINASDLGLGAVENQALSTWTGSSNLSTCSQGTFRNGATTAIWTGTATEYAAITTKDSNTIYFVIED